jgi:O-antigen/teichoic acid export membrane protein
MKLKTNLLRNAGAGILGKGSIILFRLAQVPLLIYFLGVENYGRWLVLYSLPSWLALANLGFGSVASNEMSMAVSKGDIQKAKCLYSTTFGLLLIVLIFGMIFFSLFIPFITWEHYLRLSSDYHNEVVYAIFFLALNVFLSFFGELFGGRFRAAQKAYIAIFLFSFRPWIELFFMFILLQFTVRFDFLAVSILLSSICYSFLLQWLSWRALPQLSFSFREVNKSAFGELLKKGVAFQAFPLGNGLLFQGSIMIVQAVLGPTAVVLFGTARTLVRTVSQAMELINNTIWPEMSHLFGANNKQQTLKLHRVGVGISVAISLIGVVALALIGPFLYKIWIGKSLLLPYHLLLIFLLPIPFNALWLTSSVVHMASNQHEGLAKRYLLACVLSVVTCYILSYFQGIEGAALSTIVSDLVLIPYVVSQSLILTEDNWKAFFPGVLIELKSLLKLFLTKKSIN